MSVTTQDNGKPFPAEPLAKTCQNETDRIVYEYAILL